MGGRPTEQLHLDGDSLLHRLPAHVKVVGLAAFVLAVVALPARAPWAFAVAGLMAIGLALLTHIPVGHLLRRMTVEVPFLVFAVVLPFVATGPKVEVGPFVVSRDGLEGAWQLASKATIGVLASVAFATTTTPRDLVRGMQALRLPDQLVQILAFMVRYLGVVVDEMSRMRIARESRGFAATSVRAWPALASSAGALFLRSYERGERVHLAMLSRGYSGRLPETDPMRAGIRTWLVGLAPAVLVVVLGGIGRLS